MDVFALEAKPPCRISAVAFRSIPLRRRKMVDRNTVAEDRPPVWREIVRSAPRIRCPNGKNPRSSLPVPLPAGRGIGLMSGLRLMVHDGCTARL